MIASRTRLALLGFVTAFWLAACGGGDDAPAPAPAPTPTPPAVAAPTGLTYTSPSTVTVGAAANLTPTVTGSVTSYTVSPALPAGLAINATSGAITGTPTNLVDTATYTVSASNSAGSATFPLGLRVGPPAATAYTQSNLVSNGAVAGTKVDPNLVNPWGLAFSATSPAWVSNNVTNTSTLYDGTGTVLPTIVAIPAGTNGAAAPTGIVANATTEFVVSKAAVSAAARFIFAGEGGTISGWAPTVDATNAVTTYDSGTVRARYMGLAIAANGTVNTLYATDFRNGRIDVFNGTWQKVTAAGGFTDPNLPAGYAPYGIQALTLGTTTVLVVTYAQRATNGEEALGAGLGVVNVFDLNGTLQRRLVSPGGRLNAPWGVAKAPAGFGYLGNMLLIGNFGDGVVNGYDPTTGAFAGSIANNVGTAIANAGLWAIAFGNGSQNQPVNTLYLTAGISGETAGLYARIDLGATAPDVVAPTVSLTAPAAATTVSATVPVTATAADNRGVTQVNFSVRVGTTTTALGSATTAPYTVSFDTTKFANGAATLTAQAVDAAGNATTSAAVAVTINNTAAPVVTLAQLQATIFGPVCSTCHNGSGAVLPGVMNLTTASASAAALIDVASLEVPATKRVARSSPATSYLVSKIEGTQTVGAQMPLGGPFLSATDIANVRAWIAAGAAP